MLVQWVTLSTSVYQTWDYIIIPNIFIMDQSKFAVCAFFKFLIIAFAFKTAVSVQLEDVAELCPGNFITQDYNASWEDAAQFTEDVTYYLPFVSKYYAFITTQNLYQTDQFKSLTESHLENSCLNMKKIDGWGFTNVTGYDGKSLPLQMLPTEIPLLFRFQLPYPNGGVGGYASIALSDNENYNLFDFCFDNGLRAFAVLSISRQLDETSLAVIKSHAKSLGFQEKNFLNLNYLNCFDAEGNLLAPNTEDLPKPDPLTILLYRDYLLTDALLYPTFFYKKK